MNVKFPDSAKWLNSRTSTTHRNETIVNRRKSNIRSTMTRIFAAACLATAGSSWADDDIDMDNGEEINEVCASCHGEFGQGGKDGEYPRLAGMPAAFIAEQLHLFRDRKRPNIAMIEYIDERQMPDPDIRDVSAFLAVIKLKSRLPPVDETAADFDAMERLLQARQLVQIPKAKGDIEAGRKLYNKECASCHGKDGWGDQSDAVPMLAGQYTNYLWRQVEKYLKGYRIHDKDEPEDKLLKDFSNEQLRDIFAYASILDD